MYIEPILLLHCVIRVLIVVYAFVHVFCVCMCVCFFSLPTVWSDLVLGYSSIAETTVAIFTGKNDKNICLDQ